MKKLPLAKTTDIVVQTLGKEILIYDLNTHKAYNLNETSAMVYKACDGKTTFSELSAKNNFTYDIIFLALNELQKENLVEDDKSYYSHFAGMSRREAIRKVGLSTAVALPVIAMLVAPKAADAQSGTAACGDFLDSCSGAGQGTCCAGLTCCPVLNECYSRCPA